MRTKWRNNTTINWLNEIIFNLYQYQQFHNRPTITTATITLVLNLFFEDHFPFASLITGASGNELGFDGIVQSLEMYWWTNKQVKDSTHIALHSQKSFLDQSIAMGFIFLHSCFMGFIFLWFWLWVHLISFVLASVLVSASVSAVLSRSRKRAGGGFIFFFSFFAFGLWVW